MVRTSLQQNFACRTPQLIYGDENDVSEEGGSSTEQTSSLATSFSEPRSEVWREMVPVPGHGRGGRRNSPRGNKESMRPTLTEQELSRSLAWRRKQMQQGHGVRYHPIESMPSSYQQTSPPAMSLSQGGPSALPRAAKKVSILALEKPRGSQSLPCQHPQRSAVAIGVKGSSIFGKSRRLSSTPSSRPNLSQTPGFRSITLKLPRAPTSANMLRTLEQGEPIFDTLEIPVVRKWYGPSDLHYAFLKCIPLAPSCLLLSVGFIVWGLTNVVQVCIDEDSITWQETGEIVVGVFKVIIGSAGVVGVLARLKAGMHFLSVGFNVFLVSQCVSFIGAWLEWGLAMGGATTADHEKWRPEPAEIVYMVWSCVKLVLIVSVSLLFIVGMLASMKMILAIGGTGWEKKTYLEILECQDVADQEQPNSRQEEDDEETRNSVRSRYSTMALT
eukprot:Protomagalhaensia_sp_Gyna_25__5066@NODE_573_length_3079_cov_89_017434_g443_i0_p1_GENE_NODE_573_length_3079_cov_89_017434_g443_i0NODE_573_length_3079_cov_89_017434_g443_i0_p1_ORF_typecomplete_len443_score61_56AWPM19/PF05512_11/0_083Ureidogly_lyase/PF04115_12/0_19_NODE_573_length_3079_cov_89_017434_g443_i0761404